MLSEDKILEFNQYQKSDKIRFIIYADLESLIRKMNGFKNNHEKSSAVKICEHIPSGFPMSTILLFKDIENKLHVYRDKNCMKKFYECLIIKHARKKILKIKK